MLYELCENDDDWQQEVKRGEGAQHGGERLPP